MLATGSNSLANYRLSIRSGADGFSFSVGNTLDGSIVQTDFFPVSEPLTAADVLRQALRKPYLMDFQFQGVELIADTQATIIPLEHFSKSDMLAFYRLCFPGQQVSVADMQYQILSSLEVVMVFRFDQSVLRVVQECYPDVRMCCVDAQLLGHFAAMQEKRPAPADMAQRDAYVCFDAQRFFIAVFRGLRRSSFTLRWLFFQNGSFDCSAMQSRKYSNCSLKPMPSLRKRSKS